MLGEVAEDQVGRDRGHLVEPGFAEFRLNVIFLGKGEAAMGLHAGLRRLPRGFHRQHLGHVGFRAAIAPGLVPGGGMLHHQLGGTHTGIGFGDGELDALILPDRPAKHHAGARIGAGLVDELFGVADAFRGDEDALGIHAGEDR